MSRGIDDHHRAGGRHLVELGGGRRAVLGETRSLVAEADDPGALGHRLGVLLEAREQFREIGGADEVGVHQVLAEVDHVAVGVDETRHQGLAREVDLGRAGAGGLVHLGARADGEDLAIADRERLGVGRLTARHGEDVTARIHGGGGRRGRRGGLLRAAGGDEQRRGGEQHGREAQSLGGRSGHGHHGTLPLSRAAVGMTAADSVRRAASAAATAAATAAKASGRPLAVR